MSNRCFASTNQYAECPSKVWQFRRILLCPFKNLLGVLPGDLPFAVRVIKKALKRFGRPWPCSRKSLHVIEIKAKKSSPRLAEIIESRIARHSLSEKNL